MDWTSIGILTVASVIGWGLVANMFAEEASWNNWQGYFLPLVGEHWADANLGVLVALVLSFVAAWFGRRGRIRRQEGTAA
ncbi:hypothetical protein [Corynebacterium coyleae]|uniref:hypothetical protein n=1 Tax=Corynebacterium coyleae TaxID=53374 RepID=UPI001ADC754B|nr:hypothetical protein [Corynebacterium coyleae]